MKNLKLLNKKIFTILFIFIFFFEKSFSEEPEDIWNLEKIEDKEITVENSATEDQSTESDSIYKIQQEREKDVMQLIKEEKTLLSKKISVVGIYDPDENGLSLDMWQKSNGKIILQLMSKINKLNLSDDAKEIFDVAILTNSYIPTKNINPDQFLKFKEDWLIKKNNLNLIKIYLEKNPDLKEKNFLLRFYTDQYLSKGEISNACEIFDLINFQTSNYLSKFKIYCLINNDKNEEAQLQLDLLKEKGFNDSFFEKVFYYLIGYESKFNEKISAKSMLNFHLSHRLIEDFQFEPNENTSNLIWKYLSSMNLLTNIDVVDLEDKEKILNIESATNDNNYTEDDLFSLYKRFLFNINQLLNVEESYKALPNFQSRALLYQGILLAKTSEDKIKLTKILKESFNKDNIPNAFNNKLKEILNTIEKEDVPSNYTGFYDSYLEDKNIKKNKIKFNNKIIHQSKLLFYFIDDQYSKKNVEKDLESLFKKIKKNKKYIFSTKDIILIESLKSDGIQLPKKQQNIYSATEAVIPYDIQILIRKNDTGLALLRLVEIIGEDSIVSMGSETIYFIISILNQLNIDTLRNKILLKVLPLKV